MPKIWIDEYIAAKNDGSLLDDAISMWTKIFNWNTNGYSHSEWECEYDAELAMWIYQNQEGQVIPEGDNICFSSSSRTTKNKTFYGTRFAAASDVLKNAGRWDRYGKEVTDEELAVMKKRAKSIDNRPYFYSGLFFDYFIPFEFIGRMIGSKVNKWYCSQSVWFVLKNVRDRVSPRRLSTWILKDGWKLISKGGVPV